MSTLGIGEPPEVKRAGFYIFPVCKNSSHEQCPHTASDLTCMCTCHNYPKGGTTTPPAEELDEPDEFTNVPDAVLDGISGKVIETEVDGQPAVVKVGEQIELVQVPLEELVHMLVVRRRRVSDAESVLADAKEDLKEKKAEVDEIVLEICRRDKPTALQGELPFTPDAEEPGDDD